jgi:hypothetical protein
MFKETAILLFFMLTLFSCQKQDKLPAPPDLIAEAKMAGIIVDIHLLEASYGLSGVLENGRAEDEPEGFVDVYKRHGVQKEQFEKSIKYYSSDPEKINAIYEVVVNQLNKLQAEAMTKR